MKKREQAMAVQYRLRYRDVRDGLPKSVELCALSETAAPSKEPRYFHTLKPGPAGGLHSFFVKCRDPEDPAGLHRFQTEQEAAWICSPYVAALYSGGIAQTIEDPEIQRNDGRGWEQLSSQVVVYEYIPLNLEQFWQRQSGTLQEEQLEALRGQILLKLIEGTAHLHQARLVHRDIKPGNIMINCQGLCRKAAWYFPELDVKLTDMDGAHDERAGPPAFFVKSQFFQPDHPLQSGIWLDIYSLCMVAMWLYGSGRTNENEYQFLWQMSSQPLSEQNLSEVIASAGACPAPFLDCLRPALEMVLRHLGKTDFDRGMEVLCGLRDRLHDYYFGKEGWQPMELLRPRSQRPLWSAVLQIDRNYWPVLGRGCCYHALSIIDQARGGERTPAGEAASEMCSLANGESLSVFYRRRGAFEEKDGERLSFPPEIYLTCEDAEDLQRGFQLKADMYGSVCRGTTYENRLLAERKQLFFGADTVLYDSKPLYILGEDRAFLEKVRVRAVRFHENGRIKPLTVYQSPRQRMETAVNLVLLVNGPAEPSYSSHSAKLLYQIAEETQAGGGYHPRFYGLAVGEDGVPPRSFCGGRVDVGPKRLADLYVYTANKWRLMNELSWGGNQPEDGSFAFDPGLPTLVIACLEQGPERVFTWLREGRPVGDYPALRWAADYLQVFLPPEAEENLTPWEPLMPQFAAAVKPGGACVVTPFGRDPELPDPERRWLTAIRHHCCRV